MDAIWQDLRCAFRVLRTNRQFTAVAVVVLALGISAPTAVFSIVNAVMLRPLPYQDPERLVAVTSVYQAPSAARPIPVIALTDMAEWRRRSRTIVSMGAFAYTQLPVRVGSQSFSPVTALMDPEFLATLGNPLGMGTFFAADRAAAGSDLTAIVSHAFWTQALGGDGSALGRPIVVDGTPYVIRGVLAADFQFPRSDASYFDKPVDLLIPAASFPAFPAASRQWFGIARLGSGVALTEAQAELQSIAAALARDARTDDAWSVRLVALHEETTRRARQPLLIVLGISVVLLLIASTNLMNLFFSRGVARLRELSIRRAIGSTSGRLMRQLLTESVLLAALGGAAGVWLASLAIDVLVGWSPVHIPVTRTIGIDGQVLTFTLVVCLSAALAASLVPALQASSKSDEAIRHPGMRASAARAVARVQWALCVAQIALGMSLLAAAGLLAHSLWRLTIVNPGFESAQVLGFNLSVPNDHSPAERVRFYARALDEIRTIPGVERAGMISFLPPETRAGVFMGLAIEGAPPLERGAPARVVNTLVSSVDYFATMRMPVVRGRDFHTGDTAAGRPVVIVNEALVRRYLGDGDPIGRRIGTGFDRLTPVREIIGVVRDTHDRGLAVEPYPTAYIPFQQFSLPYGSVAVRTAAAPATVIAVIRDRLNRLNPSVPLADFQALDDRLAESLREPRFYTLMAAACASMAVLFVTFGLYGLVSYSVSRRTAELGIRMAIGAERAAILRLVLLQGLRMSAAGVGCGLLIAVVLTRTLRSLLFEVQPLDPPTLAMAALVVVLVTLAASYAPARRASLVNPVTALRHE
jgi:putative ABC transport system permease protein